MIISFHTIDPDGTESYYNPSSEEELKRMTRQWTRQYGYTVIEDIDTRNNERVADMRVITLTKTIKS